MPSLSTPVLADTTADGVDAGALAFLTRRAVEDARKAEEAKAAKEAEKLEEEQIAAQLEAIEPGCWECASDAAGRTYFWHHLSKRARWTLPAGAYCDGKRRKKKKKRRKRTRRPSISSSCPPCSWRS